MSSTTAVYARQVPSEDEAQDIVSTDKDGVQDDVPASKNHFAKITLFSMKMGLSPLGFAVYAYLCGCARQGQADPLITTIMDRLGASKRGVINALDELEFGVGIIERETKGGWGRKHSRRRYLLVHHTRVNFGRLNMELIKDKTIRPALYLLAYLSYRANWEATCWPTLQDMADDTNRSLSTIKRHVKLLKDANRITITKPDGQHSKYVVLHHVEDQVSECAPIGGQIVHLSGVKSCTSHKRPKNNTQEHNQEPLLAALRRASFAEGPMDGPSTKHADGSQNVYDSDWVELEEGELNQQAFLEPPPAEPVFHLYDEPAGPFRPLTDIELAKDALLDLMQVNGMRNLSLMAHPPATLESQLQAKLDVVGIEGWLESIKRIERDPEPHRHLTVADLLAA